MEDAAYSAPRARTKGFQAASRAPAKPFSGFAGFFQGFRGGGAATVRAPGGRGRQRSGRDGAQLSEPSWRLPAPRDPGRSAVPSRPRAGAEDLAARTGVAPSDAQLLLLKAEQRLLAEGDLLDRGLLHGLSFRIRFGKLRRRRSCHRRRVYRNRSRHRPPQRKAAKLRGRSFVSMQVMEESPMNRGSSRFEVRAWLRKMALVGPALLLLLWTGTGRPPAGSSGRLREVLVHGRLVGHGWLPPTRGENDGGSERARLERWIESRHRAAPGVDWHAVEAANRQAALAWIAARARGP